MKNDQRKLLRLGWLFLASILTKRLPADAGRFIGMVFDTLKYNFVRDIATGRDILSIDCIKSHHFHLRTNFLF
ncbi:hypothetical protein XBFFR1_970005 [Xenorhabdus bovienii str. feltiae France]|nr:hypothetical protein XBFFR1_970005 [Xenorhabdus bovienii str. feltiae France]